MRTLAILLLLCAPAFAQAGLNQDVEMRLDPKGDASATIVFTLPAAGWQQWKGLYGDNPDVLKRDLTHRFSAYEIVNFDLKKDDVKRTATATLRMNGAAANKGQGRFEVLIPADWKKMTEGREWIFSYSQVMGQASLFSQTIKVLLPEKASGWKLSDAAEGNRTLSYQMPVSGGGNPWSTVGGLSLACLLILTALRFTVAKGG